MKVDHFHFNEGHLNAIRMLGIDNIHDLEHFKMQAFMYKWGEVALKANCAVLVMNDNTAYIGYSICAPIDQYNKRRGYVASVGRALANALRSRSPYEIDSQLEGVALRDEARRLLRKAFGDRLLHKGDLYMEPRGGW